MIGNTTMLDNKGDTDKMLDTTEMGGVVSFATGSFSKSSTDISPRI